MKTYGDYIAIRAEESWQEGIAKEKLREQMHEFIDRLCDDDEFWIKKDTHILVDGVEIDAKTIGWKIAIPQMED